MYFYLKTLTKKVEDSDFSQNPLLDISRNKFLYASAGITETNDLLSLLRRNTTCPSTKANNV